MDKVLNELRNVQSVLENKMESRFSSVNAELKRLEDKQDTRYTILIWAMGILMAMMIALKFFGK